MNTSGAMYLCACCVCLGFRLYGLGFGVKGLADVVLGPRRNPLAPVNTSGAMDRCVFRVYVSVCVLSVFRFRVYGLGFRV